MAKEKNLVEDALIQMKNLEEAVAENAKGILASTMKQEIKELVKESIVSEQGDDDEEIGADDEMDMDMDSDEMDMDSDEDEMDMDSDEMDMDMDSDISDTEMSDDDVIDLSGSDISDDDLLKVFLAMDDEDGITVKRDNNMINLKDDNIDKEYMIQTESDDEMYEDDMEMYEDDMEMDEDNVSLADLGLEQDEMYEEDMDSDEEDMDIDAIIDQVFSNDVEPMDENDEEVVYEIEMDESAEGEDDEMYEMDMDESEEESMYEIEMDEQDDEMYEQDDIQMESTKPKIGKGAKIGKPKFSYKKTSGGFKENMKQGTRGVGMGKGPKKFEFKEEKKDISNAVKKEMAPFKKKETKEAARTYGMGSKSGRGLRKGITPNRNLTFEGSERNLEQIQILREKNEEYRKALNVFRDKLNEVAVFNSNLAYATRLFTEHSTSKQEKINILRRFDGVESLKESKNLYRTIKSELTSTNKPSINESIERKIENSPSSGSASTLIESKTYENPQFLRMKDIMSKIIK